MVQELEAIKGGGGSNKVGTKGTTSSLMTRELDSVKPTQQTPVSVGHKSQKIPALIASGSSTPKRPKLRKSLDGASTSGNGSNNSYKSLSKNPHQIPMLDFVDVALDRTPSRQKSNKKACNIVDFVDIKYGKHPGRARSSPRRIDSRSSGSLSFPRALSRPAIS
ncbi:uncharacterized protein LOC120209394 [Hibiscus syriacus]|uniref:uncharacterized protein LOC120209394 n=1 Tax=Hibiscus syriacus TaxID=106335 RepID=UPI0019213BD5|nr:uncharacterized protein LOC120209394 [Hibiscus syriacus]